MEKSNPIVATKQGKLRGSAQKLFDGTTFYSFKGIPYAQAPVGKLRFKAPLPPKPWSGVRDAFEHGPVCPQLDMFTATLLEGNEDCLFLNVYTRTLLPTAKLPVIVFIHGGAFMSGSGNDDILGPRFLLQHDVILVTFNYRLDVLGFLCLDIPEVPGNAGLKDQVAALSWIQNNIEQFGGDASNITLGGESAGSSSVTYHLLSPTSKGLFHKAIAQSGVCLNDWSKGLNSTERAFKVGKILGKQTNNPYELLDFLQSVPATKLVGLTNKVKSSDETHRCLPIHFVPVVEKRFKNAEPFIDQEPLDMLLLNKVNEVPLLIGYNSHEGLISVNNMMKKVDVFEREPHYLVPREIFNKTSQSTVNVFGERIKEFYFKNGFREQSDAEKYLTDYHFAVCIYRFAFFYAASKQPVYFFRFSINSEMNAFKSLMGFDGVKGASHADDLFYLFDNVINKSKYEEQEKARELVFTATKLWTDFAKTGDPTPSDYFGVKWPAYTRSKKEFLNISNQLTQGVYPDKERHEFWDKVYRDAGIPNFNKSNL